MDASEYRLIEPAGGRLEAYISFSPPVAKGDDPSAGAAGLRRTMNACEDVYGHARHWVNLRTPMVTVQATSLHGPPGLCLVAIPVGDPVPQGFSASFLLSEAGKSQLAHGDAFRVVVPGATQEEHDALRAELLGEPEPLAADDDEQEDEQEEADDDEQEEATPPPVKISRRQTTRRKRRPKPKASTE